MEENSNKLESKEETENNHKQDVSELKDTNIKAQLLPANITGDEAEIRDKELKEERGNNKESNIEKIEEKKN